MEQNFKLLDAKYCRVKSDSTAKPITVAHKTCGTVSLQQGPAEAYNALSYVLPKHICEGFRA